MASDKKNIVIIGGGIIGSTSAYFLTRHPAFNPALHTITLLEATKVAGGASGKAGGLLALWAYPTSIVPLSYRLHAQLAKEHGGEERWGYRRVHVGQVECRGRSLPAKSSVKGKDREMDGQNGTPNGKGEARVSLQKRTREALGKLTAAGVPADLDWVDPDALCGYDEMGTPDTTAQVHPYQFTTSMASLAEEKGAKVILGSVTAINQRNDAVESVTYTDKTTGEKHTIPASDVVIAAGPWTKKRDHPAYTRGIGVRPLHRDPTPHRLRQPLQRIEQEEQRCQDIVDYVGSISDELRDGEVTARQACYLPNVQARGSNGPLIGETGVKGLLMASGHTCWGIQNGPGTGKVISEFVFEGGAKSAQIGALDPRRVL
ncbi:FAD dependent oxidoreductase-domain-containing protein [Cryomyces antarcticus]